MLVIYVWVYSGFFAVRSLIILLFISYEGGCGGQVLLWPILSVSTCFDMTGSRVRTGSWNRLIADSFGGRYVAISLIVVSRNSAGPASVLGSAFLLPTLSSLSSAALSSRLAVLVPACCTSAFDQLFVSFFGLFSSCVKPCWVMVGKCTSDFVAGLGDGFRVSRLAIAFHFVVLRP